MSDRQAIFEKRLRVFQRAYTLGHFTRDEFIEVVQLERDFERMAQELLAREQP